MDTFSGLNQPGINLGGLLNMGGLSGMTGHSNGASLGGSADGGGGGMPGGMDLAELIKMLGEQQGDAPAVGMNQQLGTLPTSLAQQQALGQGGFQQQPYLTAGSMGQQGGGSSVGAGSPDPLALIQKFLGLAQKGAGITGLSQQSLLPSPTGEQQQFDPTGQMQQQGVQEFRAGERGDYGGFDLNNFQSLLQGSNPLLGSEAEFLQRMGPAATPEMFQQMRDFMGGQPGSSLQGGGMFGSTPTGSESMLSLTDSGGNPLSGFNPTVGNSLGALTALLGLYSGIQNENPYGITGGALGTGASLASMSGYPGVGGAIGALGGPLSLAAGIQNEDPMGIASGALQSYNSLAGVAFPEYSLGTLASEGFAAAFPELAASLGIGGAAAGATGAAATAGSAIGTSGMAGAAAAGEGLGTAGAAGGSVAGGVTLAAIPLAIALGIFSHNEGVEMAQLLKKSKESVGMQSAIPGIAQDITSVARMADPNNYANMSTDQLLALYPQMEEALVGRRGTLSKVQQSKGSEAPSRVPRIDTAGVESLMKYADNYLIPQSAALQDELYRRGVPLDQYWSPFGQQDFLGLTGHDANIDPSVLANIGPGNMLDALKAYHFGTPFENLPQGANVGQARLTEMQRRLAEGQGSEYAGYFLTPDQRAAMAQSQANYFPGMDGTESASAIGPQGMTAQQYFASLMGGYQLPGAPQGMFAPPPQAAAPEPQGPGLTQDQLLARIQAMMPQQTALQGTGLMNGMLPQFNAQGADDPMTMLRQWAQYGGTV